MRAISLIALVSLISTSALGGMEIHSQMISSFGIFELDPVNSALFKGLEPGDIIGFGLSVWDLIIDNTITNNVDEKVSHALPKIAGSPMQLSRWKAGQSDPIVTLFKDPIGGEVARFEYQLIYEYDGNFRGQGQYLANVTILPGSLSVKTFYNLNAKVQVLPPVNIGTSEDPIAQLSLILKIRVKDRLLGGENGVSTYFTVKGSGEVTAEKK